MLVPICKSSTICIFPVRSNTIGTAVSSLAGTLGVADTVAGEADTVTRAIGITVVVVVSSLAGITGAADTAAGVISIMVVVVVVLIIIFVLFMQHEKIKLLSEIMTIV